MEGRDVRGRDEAGMRGDLRSDARPARVRPGHVHRAVLRQERRQRHAVQEQRCEVGGHSPARLHDRGRLLRREGSGRLGVAEIRPRAEVVRPEPMDPMRHAPHVTAADQSLRNPGRAQVATGERPASLGDVRQGQGRRDHARDDGSTRTAPPAREHPPWTTTSAVPPVQESRVAQGAAPAISRTKTPRRPPFPARKHARRPPFPARKRPGVRRFPNENVGGGQRRASSQASASATGARQRQRALASARVGPRLISPVSCPARSARSTNR